MSLPYFPMFPTDFEADTSHLTLAEDGAFNRLLRLCWITPKCSVPADHAWLQRRMRCGADEYESVVKPILEEFFTIKGRAGNKRYTNKRLYDEFVQASASHSRRSKAGKQGNEIKRLKNKGFSPRNASAKRTQPEPEPKPFKIKNKNGEWVLAVIPDEGTKARILCDLMIGEKGQAIWASWFNAKQVAFDGDNVRPLNRVASRKLSENYGHLIRHAGMTLGEVWAEGLTA